MTTKDTKYTKGGLFRRAGWDVCNDAVASASDNIPDGFRAVGPPLAAEPGAAPFVTVGAQVAEGQTVLIIEAMKVMNPIKAPKAGTVSQVLVGDAQPVEHGGSPADACLTHHCRDAPCLPPPGQCIGDPTLVHRSRLLRSGGI